MTYKTFAQSTFNPQMDHNARFAKKKLDLRIDTMDALLSYIENGGTITVCKPGKRSKANTSFPVIRGSIAHRGAQVNGLRKAGYGKANGG